MDKVAAIKAVNLNSVQGMSGMPQPPVPSSSPGSSAARTDFDAAMRSAEQRAVQSFDVPPQQADAAGSHDIGSGFQNMAKSFSNYADTHFGSELKALVNSDPSDPHHLTDMAAFSFRGAVNNLQFTMASKMVGQTSKNLDTLFKSS